MTAHNNNFGGFSSKSVTIDVRFETTDQIDHFVKAWTAKGPPKITATSISGRMEQISIGTAVEHELRHYHDFLLCYGSVHNFWLALQATINALPLVFQILDNPRINTVVFPLTSWAETLPDKRAEYLADELGNERQQFIVWDPPLIVGDRPKTDVSKYRSGEEPEYLRDVLFLLREQMAIIQRVRGGELLPRSRFRFSARFVFELSAFMAQIAAVIKTYGHREFDEFVNRLAQDHSIYAKFFSHMIAIFHARKVDTFDGKLVVVDSANVDWDALSAMTTWCLAGCSVDRDGLYPAVRLASVLEAASQNFDAVFPPSMDAKALLSHLDNFFSTMSLSAAAEENSRRLRGFYERASEKFSRVSGDVEIHTQCLRVFNAVLTDRERLIERLSGDVEGYLHYRRYVDFVHEWPQCPIYLNFSPAGVALRRDFLSQLGRDARFDVHLISESGHATDVLYSSFLSTTSSFAVDDIIALGRARTLCDLFLDPAQTSPEDESAIRAFVQKEFGKTLLRLM